MLLFYYSLRSWMQVAEHREKTAHFIQNPSIARSCYANFSFVMMLFGILGRLAAFFRARGIFFENLFRDGDGVRHLFGGGAGEGSVEAGDIDAAILAQL